MPALQIVAPDGGSRSVSWVEGCIGIGRDPTNHVVLDHPSISRWHAAILLDPGPMYRIRSLRGRPDIRLGSGPVRSHPLQGGDEIQIGPFGLRFSGAVPKEVVRPRRPGVSIRLVDSTSDPLGGRSLGQELRAPDWTDAGWGTEHAPGPSPRELFISVQAVASSLDLDEMLSCLLEQVHELTSPSVSFAALLEDDGNLEVRVRRTSSSRDPGPDGPRVSQSTVRQCIESGLPYLAVHAAKPRLSMGELGIVRALCLPLIADTRVRGIVYADWRRWGDVPVEEARLEWLAALALYAGSAFENALHHDRLRLEHERLQIQHARVQQSQRTRTQIVGVSVATRRLLEEVDLCAARDVPVLILGPTGSGKELVARRIHECSKRHEGPFVPVNCAAIPRDLFESEMFGIDPQALPGVPAGRPGRFREADHGTLFLDEIGELSLDHQARLLRALEDPSISPVGGRGRPLPVDIRIIAATNRDLRKSVEEGTFREDLFNRLGVPIRTVPLSERPEDIPILAYYLLDALTQAHGEAWHEISPKVMDALQSYRWPGNVRQLARCLRNALVFAGERIEIADLRHDPDISGDAKPLPTLVEVEAEHIRRVLRATAGNQARAAAILKVAPNTLKKKMDEYGIRRADSH